MTTLDKFNVMDFLQSAQGHLFVRRTCISKTLLTLPHDLFENALRTKSLIRATFVIPTRKNGSIKVRLADEPDGKIPRLDLTSPTDDPRSCEHQDWILNRNAWINSIKAMQKLFDDHHATLELLESEEAFTYNLYADDKRVVYAPLWLTHCAIDSLHSSCERVSHASFFSNEINRHLTTASPCD